MSSIEEEGRRIAERLSKEVDYHGPWLPKGKFFGYFFRDKVTGSSFTAKTFEEAKASLIEMRKDYGAKPPVFANNPGNTLTSREEWNRSFLRVLPVASLGLGVVSAAMTIMPFLSRALAQRVSYEDSQYLVSVRYPGQWRDIREFITPYAPEVQQIYQEVGPDTWALYDWVSRNISYRLDIGEFFQFPRETIARSKGDCEDTSLLLVSLAQNFDHDVWAVLGSYQGFGHAWGLKNSNIYETTYTSARPVPDPEHYIPFMLFNDHEVIELWTGALDDIFRTKRDEAAKLNLMAAACGEC